MNRLERILKGKNTTCCLTGEHSWMTLRFIRFYKMGR